MKNLKLNSKVEIINRDEKKAQGIIHDIDEGKIIITVPSDDKDFKLFRVGEEINCIAYNRKNTVGFFADIIERVYKGLPAYVLANARDFQKIQRRQDVRIPISIEVLHTSNKFLIKTYEKNREEEVLKKAKRYLKEGIMADISAGGAKFTSYDNFPQGSILLLSFKLGDESFFTKANVLHKSIRIVSKKTVYTYGVEFKDISENEREKIISYIFLMMRKKRIK